MRYLVSISFVEGQQEALAALMSAEQARVRELMAQGVLEAIYVARDRSRVWLVMNGESQDDVRQALTSLPMYRYMVPDVTPLLDINPAQTRIG